MDTYSRKYAKENIVAQSRSIAHESEEFATEGLSLAPPALGFSTAPLQAKTQGPVSEQNQVILRKKTKPFVPKHNSDAFSKKKQQKSLHKSMVAAYQMTTKALTKIDSKNRTYKRWMDAGKTDTSKTESRVLHVKDGFEKIQKCLKEDEITFKDYALADGEKDTTYAYILSSEKGTELRNIFIGGAFWDAKIKRGKDTKAGTIIHELSHLLHNTKDHYYGTGAAKRNAKNDPAKATTNADNYEYLAESS